MAKGSFCPLAPGLPPWERQRRACRGGQRLRTTRHTGKPHREPVSLARIPSGNKSLGLRRILFRFPGRFCWLNFGLRLTVAVLKSRCHLLLKNAALRRQLLVLSRKTSTRSAHGAPATCRKRWRPTPTNRLEKPSIRTTLERPDENEKTQMARQPPTASGRSDGVYSRIWGILSAAFGAYGRSRKLNPLRNK